MNDAIALLAISQMVSLLAIAYLYSQVQSLKRQAPLRRARPVPSRVAEMPHAVGMERSTAADRVAARTAYGAKARDVRTLVAETATRPAASGVDIAALARRMNRSEEEVRLLLRRKGMVS